jgi:hypothetical protein
MGVSFLQKPPPLQIILPFLRARLFDKAYLDYLANPSTNHWQTSLPATRAVFNYLI